MYNGTDLELMGKTASKRFVEDGTALNVSITKVAEQYGLNREQVNRVSEAANVEAYLALNDKADDKYIEFVTADPEHIYEKVSSFNNQPKTAGIHSDYKPVITNEDFIFFKEAEKHDDEAVLSPSLLKVASKKLNGLTDRVEDYLYELDADFNNESNTLYQIIKQSSLRGIDFDSIKQASYKANPTKFTEVLFSGYENKLKKEAPALSFEKSADFKGIVNKKHPIIVQINKLADLKDAYIETKKVKTEFDTLKKIVKIAQTNKTAAKNVRVFKSIGQLMSDLFNITWSTAKAGGRFVMEHPVAAVGIPGAGVVGYGMGKKRQEVEDSPMNLRNPYNY